MADYVMMSLGPFRFEVGHATYQTLVMTQSWRWPEQARIGREPALQFVGRDATDIKLRGVLFPQFDGGLREIEAMRELADQGKPVQLVDGLGRVWGAWVITEVGDTRSVLMDNGQPRRIEFEVKLKSYGEDETVTQTTGGVWSPFAMLSTIGLEAFDPTAAIGSVLDALPGVLQALREGGSAIRRGSLLQQALSDLVSPLRTALNRAQSELRSQELRIDSLDAAIERVVTLASAPMSSLTVLATQIADLLQALDTAAEAVARLIASGRGHAAVLGALTDQLAQARSALTQLQGAAT